MGFGQEDAALAPFHYIMLISVKYLTSIVPTLVAQVLGIVGESGFGFQVLRDTWYFAKVGRQA